MVYENYSVGLVEDLGLLFGSLRLADVGGPLELLTDRAQHQAVAHQNLICLSTAGAAGFELLNLFDFSLSALYDFDDVVQLG